MWIKQIFEFIRIIRVHLENKSHAKFKTKGALARGKTRNLL
jgi:hypothetical protein